MGHDLLDLRGQEEYVLSASFSPDGLRIMTTTMHGMIILWDAQSMIEEIDAAREQVIRARALDAFYECQYLLRTVGCTR